MGKPSSNSDLIPEKKVSLANQLQSLLGDAARLNKLFNFTLELAAPGITKKYSDAELNLELTPLSSRGDSRVYKVSNGQETVIVRWIDNKADLTEAVNALLSSSVAPYIAYHHHKVVRGHFGETNNVVINPYLQNSDLQNFFVSIKDPGVRINKIKDFLLQLTGIFRKLAEAKLVWSDLKLSNLLLDKAGRLQIADLKAFQKVDDISAVPARDFNFYTTPGYCPKQLELELEKKVDFNQLWVYQIGILLNNLIASFPKEDVQQSTELQAIADFCLPKKLGQEDELIACPTLADLEHYLFNLIKKDYNELIHELTDRTVWRAIWINDAANSTNYYKKHSDFLHDAKVFQMQQAKQEKMDRPTALKYQKELVKARSVHKTVQTYIKQSEDNLKNLSPVLIAAVAVLTVVAAAATAPAALGWLALGAVLIGGLAVAKNMADTDKQQVKTYSATQMLRTCGLHANQQQQKTPLETSLITSPKL